MASSQSIGTTSLISASASREFALRFAQCEARLHREVAEASSVDELQRGPLQVLAQARADLTAATPMLTAHDRAHYESTLTVLRSLLDSRRQALAQQGFKFKRKERKAVPKAAEIAPTPTSIDGIVSDAVRITQLDHRLYTWAGGQDKVSVDIAHVAHSVVDLRSATAVSVHIRHVSHSVLLLPEVHGSLMAHYVTDSLLVCPCAHQVRVHDSHRSALQVATKHASLVTIDHCTALRFFADPHGRPVHIQDFDTPTPGTNYTLTHRDITPLLARHTDVDALLQCIA